MSFVWVTPPDEALTALVTDYQKAIHTAVHTLAMRYAPEIEAWMKTNASWTDRTGNARQTLFTEVEDVANQSVTLYLSGGVEYQIFLELSNGGSYAIIGPALDYFTPKIWADVKRLFE